MNKIIFVFFSFSDIHFRINRMVTLVYTYEIVGIVDLVINTNVDNHFLAHSMSLTHFTEQIFDDSIIDNKITAISAKDMKNHNDFLYPYNLTVFRTMPTLDNVRFSVGTETDKYENSK